MELPETLEINVLSIEINGRTYRSQGLVFRLDEAQFQSPTLRTEAQREAESYPRDPMAKSMADLVTPKQLGLIRAKAREVGLNADEECQNVLRCKTDELSKRAASSFIDHLIHIGRERGVA